MSGYYGNCATDGIVTVHKLHQKVAFAIQEQV